MRRTLLLVPTAALLALAGCGSGPGGSSSPARPADNTHGGALHVAATSLGQVLVDGAGRTVYLLTADAPGRSSCNESCLAAWPPVAPPAGTSLPGITAPVGRTTTPGGDAIATVAGRPVYTYALDEAAGDVNGEGIVSYGGTWYAVSPSGRPVTSGSASTGPSTPPAYGY